MRFFCLSNRSVDSVYRYIYALIVHLHVNLVFQLHMKTAGYEEEDVK